MKPCQSRQCRYDSPFTTDSQIVEQRPQVQKKMKELDKKEMKSKSLIANILDMDDDYHPATKEKIFRHRFDLKTSHHHSQVGLHSKTNPDYTSGCM